MAESSSKRKPGPPKGDPRMVEHGRRGGAMIRDQLGADFYKEIGAKGGRRTKELHGSAHYSAIGRKGGTAPIGNDSKAQ